MFFVDTTPFVKSYFTDPEGQTYDWRGVKSRRVYINSLLKDVDLALRESTATWKIVVGHHAIRSISHHGDTEELVKLLLPILGGNSVDFYLNGHDHCLQHIEDADSGMLFLTSGAGSKAWRGDTKSTNRAHVRFFYDGQGFTLVHLAQDSARIVFYDVFGEALHEWSTLKNLRSSV
ncbi:hypothetical protein SAY87_004462 [Trapa incisa]|uniref:Calcineurin-like phosphoesterase domain-containing protein n=1 Tax=Trapa incisa TaxID=236973 RepID=A0AAN7PSP5_9MYRT|nr:hypothetical protein SAY87_004462 [Trapa incisa]